MSTTGTLDINVGAEKRTLSWNGDVKDREAARKAFEALDPSYTLAVVQTGPRTGVQVSTWEQIEDAEKEEGTVAVSVTTALKGG